MIDYFANKIRGLNIYFGINFAKELAENACTKKPSLTRICWFTGILSCRDFSNRNSAIQGLYPDLEENWSKISYVDLIPIQMDHYKSKRDLKDLINQKNLEKNLRSFQNLCLTLSDKWTLNMNSVQDFSPFKFLRRSNYKIDFALFLKHLTHKKKNPTRKLPEKCQSNTYYTSENPHKITLHKWKTSSSHKT